MGSSVLVIDKNLNTVLFCVAGLIDVIIYRQDPIQMLLFRSTYNTSILSSCNQGETREIKSGS